MKIPELPDTKEWQPRNSATVTLQSAFLKHCLATEKLIKLRVEAEKNTNIDNFDSGLVIEDIFREELRKILPHRYSIESGVLIDRNGHTGGDYDFVLFNKYWFQQVKNAATAASRRSFYPIEGVYAVGEIKQSLDYVSLDNSLRKLVVAHRLKRPHTNANRIVENRESSSCIYGLSNPLYSFIIATELAKGVSVDELINRFFDINHQLERLHVVRALCVLDQGTVIWCYRDLEHQEIKPALFMLEDLYEPIIPGYMSNESPLFGLLSNLMLHLFHSVLAPEDISDWYGTHSRKIKVPESHDISIQPDKMLLERFKTGNVKEGQPQ